MTDKELKDIVDQALESFWSTVAKRIPQATTGDLSPLTVVDLDKAAFTAVKEWWNNNCPDLI